MAVRTQALGALIVAVAAVAGTSSATRASQPTPAPSSGSAGRCGVTAPVASASGAHLYATASLSSSHFAQNLPGYAGSYFDQSGGGIATFLYTSDPRQRWQDLAERFAYPDHLCVERATYTLKQLTTVEGRIVHDLHTLARQGVQVVTIDIRVPQNRVIVRVSNETPTTAASLAARYGPALVVAPGQPVVLEGYRQ